jgi:hypothetical protein
MAYARHYARVYNSIITAQSDSPPSFTEWADEYKQDCSSDEKPIIEAFKSWVTSADSRATTKLSGIQTKELEDFLSAFMVEQNQRYRLSHR